MVRRRAHQRLNLRMIEQRPDCFNRTLFSWASVSTVNLINSIPGRPHCRMNLADGTFSHPWHV